MGLQHGRQNYRDERFICISEIAQHEGVLVPTGTKLIQSDDSGSIIDSMVDQGVIKEITHDDLLSMQVTRPLLNQSNSDFFEAAPEHWSSPNGCHQDCPACDLEIIGERPPLTADDLKGGL